MTGTRHNLVAVLAITATASGMTSAAAHAAGTRAGATRAAKRHVVTMSSVSGSACAHATSTCTTKAYARLRASDRFRGTCRRFLG